MTLKKKHQIVLVAAVMLAMASAAAAGLFRRARTRACCPSAQPSIATSQKPPSSAADVPRKLFDGQTLAGWKRSDFASPGEVGVKDGNLVIGFGEGGSGATYTGKFPTLNYEVSLEAQRVDGRDFFCGLTFPVERSPGKIEPCSLIVGGWGGGVVGLSSINGSDASENETTKYQEFQTGRWYRVRLRVTKPKIEAWIDDEKIIDFATRDHKLSIRIEVEASKPFGIATWHTTAALRNIEVRAAAEPASPVPADDP